MALFQGLRQGDGPNMEKAPLGDNLRPRYTCNIYISVISFNDFSKIHVEAATVNVWLNFYIRLSAVSVKYSRAHKFVVFCF